MKWLNTAEKFSESHVSSPVMFEKMCISQELIKFAVAVSNVAYSVAIKVDGYDEHLQSHTRLRDIDVRLDLDGEYFHRKKWFPIIKCQ